MTPAQAAPLLAVSADGYVRLPATCFRGVALRHFHSALDQTLPAAGGSAVGASCASISGLTEWVSETWPVLSLGWDWYLDLSAGSPHYARTGFIRTNVMLTDEAVVDLGTHATETLLGAAIDAMDWQGQTSQYINERYGCHLSELTAAGPPAGL